MRRAIVAAVVAPLLAAGAILAAGDWLSRPAHRVIGPPPADLAAVTVRLPTSATDVVSGWFAPGSGRGAVLLLHGVRADRRQMLARALWLRAEGYAVLLIDLPAHGESSGDRITFGAHESAGVLAGLRFLQARLPGERIGVVGVSLGAAALVLSGPWPAPSAVVLESLYPTIEEAVQDRLAMRLGAVGPWLAPLLLWQLPMRTGVQVEHLRPIEAIAALRAPLLLASGTEDRHTPWHETERLFAAAAQPKALWPVQGAAHVDLHGFDPAAYRARVLPFFARHLRGED